jgi:hypothetical protein
MKTTFDIPDDLLHRAKVTAARAGVSMRSLVIEGLAHSVAAAGTGAEPRPPSWRRAFGGMHHRREASPELLQSIEEAFEHIDDEHWG